MAIADDISVAVNGDIRYTGTTANYTVIELHRFLQDLADDAVSTGDDLHDITDETSSDRSTDNIVTINAPYNIDDTLAQHLYDGSITQNGGATIYAGLVVVGAVEAGTNIIIVQNDALLTDYWTAFPNADTAANILMRTTVKTRSDGANINGQRLIVQAREFGDSYAEFSVTMALGNNTAALFTSNDLNNATASGTVGAYDKIDNVEGYQLLEISGSAPAEPYYSQWQVTGTGTLPVSPVINDVYEYAKYIQRRGTAETIHGMAGELFRGITHEWAYDGIVGAEPATNEIIAWGAFLNVGVITGTFAIGEVVTGGTSGAVGRILGVDVTNTSLVISTETGTWASGELVTGVTSTATATTSAAAVGQAFGGGVAVILAVDSVTNDEVWVQLIKGAAPLDNAICYQVEDHARSVTVFGVITSRAIAAPFIGASTGAALLGAFGIGLDPTDASASDLFIDLNGIAVTPPNNVTFTVGGLVTGEDYVLVGPESGGLLNTAQFTTVGTLSTVNVTSVTIDTSIPTDTPSSGTIRVFDDAGVARRLRYTSYTGAVFTIDPTASEVDVANVADFDVTNATTGNNMFISYIDVLATGASASFTSVYSTDRALFIRVRDGGVSPIKTFETTGTLGSAGGSSTAIRTTDA